MSTTTPGRHRFRLRVYRTKASNPHGHAWAFLVMDAHRPRHQQGVMIGQRPTWDQAMADGIASARDFAGREPAGTGQ